MLPEDVNAALSTSEKKQICIVVPADLVHFKLELFLCTRLVCLCINKRHQVLLVADGDRLTIRRPTHVDVLSCSSSIIVGCRIIRCFSPLNAEILLQKTSRMPNFRTHHKRTLIRNCGRGVKMWVTIITKLELGVVLAATVNCEHMKYDENFHTIIKVERLKGFYDNKDLLHFGLEIRHIGKPLNSFYWTGNIFFTGDDNGQQYCARQDAAWKIASFKCECQIQNFAVKLFLKSYKLTNVTNSSNNHFHC